VTYNAGMGDDREPIALAIDIGGTFTDLAAVDRRDGSLILAKVATTPSRLQQGVLSALERSELDPADVGAFVHGSTVVINAITERRGARVALVTTQGFRVMTRTNGRHRI
jgi:N-methylhydantoinase A